MTGIVRRMPRSPDRWMSRLRFSRTFLAGALAALAVTGAARPARAQDNSVAGKVVVSGTTEPIRAAQITVSGGTQGAVSDEQGPLPHHRPDRHDRDTQRASHRLSNADRIGARRADRSRRLTREQSHEPRSDRRHRHVGRAGKARDRQLGRHDRRVLHRRHRADPINARPAQRSNAKPRRHADVGTGRHGLANPHSRQREPFTRQQSADFRRRRPRQQPSRRPDPRARRSARRRSRVSTTSTPKTSSRSKCSRGRAPRRSTAPKRRTASSTSSRRRAATTRPAGVSRRDRA